MRILLLGATGFLGRHICAHLLTKGHDVVAAVRDTVSARRRFPGIEAIHINMNHLIEASSWKPYLVNVDAVVNCAGILQSGPGQSAAAIHTKAPLALFEACIACNVKRVIQISAVSADEAAGTEYARTKKTADDYLRLLDLDWTVLRPSLVYAQGSFGGTSALRGLAGLPFIAPVAGDGSQKFQPIHAADLAETVARCLASSSLSHRTLDPVGPETMSMREIILRLRLWLDLPPARIMRVPIPVVRAAARLEDMLGRGALRSTAVDQLLYGNTSGVGNFESQIGFKPRSMDEALLSSPSHVQDRWHARLYWLRPCLTATLALLWIGSGLFSLMNLRASISFAIGLGLVPVFANLAAWIFALLDCAIGVGIILDRPRVLGSLQLALVAGYTAIFTFRIPGLWLDPLGPLLKNIPAVAAIAVWMALRDEK